MMPGPQELLLILLIAVVIFGAKRIPEIMGGLGQGIKSFKKAMEGEDTVPAPQPQQPVTAPPAPITSEIAAGTTPAPENVNAAPTQK
jgi:sec-independent protein translocase protein TatA